jgi:broad specificity phosphatase PhoE
MTLERIFLIRHGETDWNAARRWQGFAQTELNTSGLAQAQALARYLAGRPITALYTSDLLRAQQTADALGAVLKLMPQVDERWREIHVGGFQGLTTAEVEQRFPGQLAARQTDLWGFVHPGGESWRDLQVRAGAAWHQVTQTALGPEAAIVSHGGTIKALLGSLLGEDDPRLTVGLPNTSITEFVRRDAAWSLVRMAETPHL